MGDADARLTVEELLLGEGEPAAREALRREIADDPLRTLELAETVALFEGFGQLRTEPSARFACRLHDVVGRAERAAPRPAPRRLRDATWLAAAAAVWFAVLWAWDPLDACHRAPRASGIETTVPGQAPGAGPLADGDAGADADADREAGVGQESAASDALAIDAPAPLREPEEVAWEQAVESMRLRLGLEGSRHLGEAFEDALRGSGDPLTAWIDPRNALASLRAGHERRQSPELRRAALRHQGGIVAADARVQELAGLLAADLRLLRGGLVQADLPAVALAVRALIAAGSIDAARADALAAGGEWLAVRIADCSDARLVTALAALVEFAAVYGERGDVVARHGKRLVDDVLRADPETWGRRRPELLTATIAAATVGDAARTLSLLPAFGVDASRCRIVRQLLLGSLRERRAAGDDGPELLAAMLYGGGDLLSDGERAEVERQLRRWTPLRLAPDFVTVQQLAWGYEPGRLGHARLQLELRRLAVLRDPGQLAPRAAYCLCLATGYAAWPVGDAVALTVSD